MANLLRILYLTKDSPFNLRGHAAQRAHSMIVEWSKHSNIKVSFFYPGDKTQPEVLGGANGFQIRSQRSTLEKLLGVFSPYHFRLLGKSFAKEVLAQAKQASFDVIIAEELTMADQARYLSKSLAIP